MVQGHHSLVVHCPPVKKVDTGPSASHDPKSHAVDAWYGTLNALRKDLEHFNDLLNTEEHARAQRFRYPMDRERFIIGHGVLRIVLSRYVHTEPQDFRFGKGEFGKPFLEGDPIHFNLSDTKDAILVAVAHGPIGADIETMRRDTDHLRVADHYFTPIEVQSIAHAADGKRRFLELWTRKEAVLKACGVGIMDDLRSLSVDGPQNAMMISHPDFVRLAAPMYHVQTLHVGTDHLVSIAAPSPIDAIELFDASSA